MLSGIKLYRAIYVSSGPQFGPLNPRQPNNATPRRNPARENVGNIQPCQRNKKAGKL